MSESIRVLIVDDSAMMRKIISDILQLENDIEVVGTARNGCEAIEMVNELSPDVVTMDIEMPVMDGLEALRRIMMESPVPVLMLSAAGKRQADITMKALDLGAVDFVEKTSDSLSLDLRKSSPEIVSKIRIASKVRVKEVHRKAPVKGRAKNNNDRNDDWVVLIGASTGGPKALPEVLSRLPGDLPAGVLVVQHMPEGFTTSFAERLNWTTSLMVKEAEDGDEILRGQVLIAPGNRHMEVRSRRIRLSDGPKVNFVRPAVDVMMRSAAQEFGSGTVGVIMTGMGTDGAKGIMEIKKHGGASIVQDKDTCVVSGMPNAAIRSGGVDHIVPLDGIADAIVGIMQGEG